MASRVISQGQDVLLAPVLSTRIEKFVNNSQQVCLRVTRQLNNGSSESRKIDQEQFEKICSREMNFQNLVTDMSLATFCRVYIVNTAVILEKDYDCQTGLGLLESMTLLLKQADLVANFLVHLHTKTTPTSTAFTSNQAAKFRNSDSHAFLVKAVFEKPFEEKNLKRFSVAFDDELRRNVVSLQLSFTNPHSHSVVHSSCRPENVIIHDFYGFCLESVVMFCGELSHLGDPAYDVGVLVGNLILWKIIHKTTADQKEVRKTFCFLLEDFCQIFINTYVEESSVTDFPRFIKSVAGYAGVEIVFRLTGASWIQELPITDAAVHEAMQYAIWLIRKHSSFANTRDIFIGPIGS